MGIYGRSLYWVPHMAISYEKENEVPRLAKPQTGTYTCYRRVVAGSLKLRRDERELCIYSHKRER